MPITFQGLDRMVIQLEMNSNNTWWSEAAAIDSYVSEGVSPRNVNRLRSSSLLIRLAPADPLWLTTPCRPAQNINQFLRMAMVLQLHWCKLKCQTMEHYNSCNCLPSFLSPWIVHSCMLSSKKNPGQILST